MALTRSNMHLLASGGAGKLWSYSTTEAIRCMLARTRAMDVSPQTLSEDLTMPLPSMTQAFICILLSAHHAARVPS